MVSGGSTAHDYLTQTPTLQFREDPPMLGLGGAGVKAASSRLPECGAGACGPAWLVMSEIRVKF